MQVSASSEENTEISVDFEKKLKLNVPDEEHAPKAEQEQGENAEEFSFACLNSVQSPVSADDAFVNGQIRPIFPVFDQTLLYRSGESEVKDDSKQKQSLRPPLRKLFVEERSELEEEEEEPVGPFCEWSSDNKTVKEATPEPCKKSNSTGFSKLWRFREFLRSSSDGRDAFVFLNNNNNNNNDNNTRESDTGKKSSKRADKSREKPTGTQTTPGQKTSKVEKLVKVSGNKRVKAETVTSVYEKYYVRNREGDKRRPYAPYRQDVVGFFTNVNGLSRNVHPY